MRYDLEDSCELINLNNMAAKEKIKAEIERRIEIATGEQYLSLKSLLSFIDSMQEEPVSEDLENEIVRWEDSFKQGPASMGYKETAIHFAEWQKNHIWTEETEKIIRKKLEDDYSQANSMVIWASRSDKPFDKDEELIMVKESANTIIKLIKKEIGV